MPKNRSKLVCRDGLCRRRHFQKNSLISGTFDPPEMYSTDRSYIETTVDPTNGLSSISVTRTRTCAFSPGLYSVFDGSTSTLSTRFWGGTMISFVSA